LPARQSDSSHSASSQHSFNSLTRSLTPEPHSATSTLLSPFAPAHSRRPLHSCTHASPCRETGPSSLVSATAGPSSVDPSLHVLQCTPRGWSFLLIRSRLTFCVAAPHRDGPGHCTPKASHHRGSHSGFAVCSPRHVQRHLHHRHLHSQGHSHCPPRPHSASQYTSCHHCHHPTTCSHQSHRLQVKLLVSIIRVLHTVAPAVLLVVHHDHSGTCIVIHIILAVVTICLHSAIMGNLQGMTAVITVVLTNVAVSLLHP
jgi:hypothetical protein